MIAILDVQYEDNRAHGGMVLIQNWTDAKPAQTASSTFDRCAEYEPGQFFKRELPVLTDLLQQSSHPIGTVVIDAYVDLAPNTPGLGQYLFRQLDEKVTVVGVAKSRYRDDQHSRKVTRGKSVRPVFVTVAGAELEDAANWIEAMHGKFRIPDMLKLADTIARRKNE